MNPAKLVAILLIGGGILSLVYGGFSYTKDSQEVKLGPVELSVKNKETVNIPVWLGAGAIVLGAVMLVAGGRKS